MVIKSVLLPGLRKALSDIVCLFSPCWMFVHLLRERGLSAGSFSSPSCRPGWTSLLLPFSQQVLTSVSRKEISS